MMRPMTCLSLLAALGAGGYLYEEKHSAQLLDREINRTIKQAEQARDRIGLLKAEWALLNEPERLQTLASQHLPQLQSLQPAQFARLEDLVGRLPAVSAAPVAATPVEDVQVAAVAALVPRGPSQPVATPAPAPASMAAPRPVARPAMPVQLAAAAPKPVAAPVAAPVVAAVVAKPVPVRAYAATHLPAELPPVAAPTPFYAAAMPAYAAPAYAAPVGPFRTPTVQTASAVAPPAPFVGSALGFARPGLAAPVPVSSVTAMVGYTSVR